MIIDTGFSHTKGINGRKEIIYPSTIALLPGGLVTARLPDGAGMLDADIIHYKDHSYIVGDFAYNQGLYPHTTLDRARLQAPEILALIFSAIIRLKPKEPTITDLAVTIPDGWYQADRDVFASHINGRHKVAYGPKAKEVELTIKKTQVFPQSLGAYANQVYHKSAGKLAYANRSISEGPAIVCDIGHGNLNLATYGRGGVYQNSNPVPISPLLGAHNLVRDSIAQIYAQTSAEFNSHQIIEAIKAGQIKIGGRPVPIVDLIGELITRQSEAIADAMRGFTGRGLNFDTVLITSGGANIFGTQVKKMYAHPNTIVAGDSADVSRGLAIYLEGAK